MCVMKANRKLIGIIGILISFIFMGLGLLIIPFFFIYGIPILIVSIFIYYNKKEDSIEQIKKR